MRDETNEKEDVYEDVHRSGEKTRERERKKEKMKVAVLECIDHAHTHRNMIFTWVH